MPVSLSPDELAESLRGGFTYLELNRGLLDRLNVFPVPDGDTGGNMTSTLSSGIETLNEPHLSMADLGERFNTEINRCSRGNSGFILARFFHGFFESTGDSGEFTVSRLIEAMANGTYHVNRALFSPVEGTMISILAAINAALLNYQDDDIVGVLKLTVETGTEALYATPGQLPVLARAGVVDSGALGLLFIFRGMLSSLIGEESLREKEEDYRFEPDPDAGNEDDELPVYRYCTEAVVQRNGVLDEALGAWLKTMGNSIALVSEDKLLKLHIHSNEPQVIFQRLETLGVLEHTKVDDMEEQTRLVAANSGSAREMAVMAFVPGEGFERIYEDLGITNCFIYDDTLPSPEEIAAALKTIKSDQVIVMPNNSNILPSVMAAREITKKSLSIIPTKSVIQGITATYGFSEDEDVASNVDSMAGFLNDAIGLFVYKSAMDTRFGDIDLKTGDWFVTRFDEVVGVGSTPADAIRASLDKIDASDVTESAVYHGNGFDPRELKHVVEAMKALIPQANIEDHFGGQSQAGLIISLE